MTDLRSRRGQILPGVIAILLIISLLVPAMVLMTQREAIWTNKQARNTSAFHLAEAGIEKGYLAISLSTLTWRNLQNGVAIDDYKFDRKYTDVPGGEYTISITSGPDVEKATIISVGRDGMAKEVRAIKAVYTNSTLGGIAIFSGSGVAIDGGTDVHWGAVVSPNPVNADSRLYPQYWSASSVYTYDTDPNPPNCDSPDCCQWHSFSPAIPPTPVLDLNAYRSSADASGTLYTTNQSWSNFTYNGGGTVYVEGNLTIGSPGIDILGSLVVTGNLTTTSGNWGKGTRVPTLPRDAWKQYCRSWATYTPFDTTEPAAFPGISSSYMSPAGHTYSPTPNGKFAVSGLMYVGGNFTISGGGGTSYIHGVAFVLGSSTMATASGVTLFYDKSASQNLQTTKIVLSRDSWQDVLQPWPGL